MPSSLQGSIIAVSYEAREKGVTRFFRGREALDKCPDIVLVRVPTAHGKSDMGVYRDFGARALKIIFDSCGPGTLLEKASVDAGLSLDPASMSPFPGRFWALSSALRKRGAVRGGGSRVSAQTGPDRVSGDKKRAAIPSR